ncbi:MAG TPA: hypothetical protein V6C65_04330 [Allocoleopsis sp.]
MKRNLRRGATLGALATGSIGVLYGVKRGSRRFEKAFPQSKVIGKIIGGIDGGIQEGLHPTRLTSGALIGTGLVAGGYGLKNLHRRLSGRRRRRR